MSIPSDPSHYPPHIPPAHPTPQKAPAAGEKVTSYLDPTGTWAKFLGPTATAQDVKMFMQGLLKDFNTIIQREKAAAKRASEQMKRSIEGNE
jgi:hypothetical protein